MCAADRLLVANVEVRVVCKVDDCVVDVVGAGQEGLVLDEESTTGGLIFDPVGHRESDFTGKTLLHVRRDIRKLEFRRGRV